MEDVLPLLDQNCSFPEKLAVRRSAYSTRRQTGAIAIMALFCLIIVIGFFALALDLARIYNRRVELQILANSAAIAGAKYLDGTKDGVDAALAAARGIVQDAANGPRYQYVNKITWTNAAMTFSASRDGSTGWKTASEAQNSAAGLMYVKVDTSALNSSYGRVAMYFAPVLSSSLGAIDVKHIAVAGKGRVHVTPIAICAMAKTARSKRVNQSDSKYDELVEYGFRRGVSYDLMQLNPDADTPVNFQVDPARLAGTDGVGNHFASWIYRPYICSGTMAVPKVTGAKVRVQNPFPLDAYYTDLNSRFDPYTGTCNNYTSPPDSNVKQYLSANISWMPLKPVVQSAKTDPTVDQKLRTVADIESPNHPNTADYGPLWSFARAVPWSSYEAQGAPEPPEGYTPFAANSTVWKALYGAGASVSGYPASSPYLIGSGSGFFQGPPTAARRPGVKYRRVLNIPLLDCPVEDSEATVLAIGKFLMTVPANATSLHAEFGGITTEDRAGGLVEIYQ